MSGYSGSTGGETKPVTIRGEVNQIKVILVGEDRVPLQEAILTPEQARELAIELGVAASFIDDKARHVSERQWVAMDE